MPSIWPWRPQPGNYEHVRSLGADHVIDYQRQSFVEVIKNKSPDGVDLAYVTVGGDVLRNSYRVMKPGGALVSIVEAPTSKKQDGSAFGRPSCSSSRMAHSSERSPD